MPSLGADMEEGTLLAWHVAPGDTVHRGDIVALVDTEKAEIEVEIFHDGVIEELLVTPGTKVPVGTPLARLRAPETRVPELPAAPPAHAAAPPRLAAAPAPPSPAARAPAAPVPHAATAPPPQRVRASPLARRIAAERGLDLARVKGTGPDGAVTRADVERALPRSEPPAAASAPAAAARRDDAARLAERARTMRRPIAAAMARSKREIPHYYLATRLDLSCALRWLETENARRPAPERILPVALLLKASALALREAPQLNGFFRDGGFEPSEAIHLGVAIALRPEGLVAPALHDADRRPLAELMGALRDLVQRARRGVLRSSEVGGATITVTNIGDTGADLVHGVIHPPQVALIGFGRVHEEPWAEGGMVGARPVVTATLAADHRASDGHRGGLFLAALARLLQQPEAL